MIRTKANRWTYLKSYLWDQLIEERSSDINPELYLLLSKGRYQLCTDKAVYSYEDRYDNFRILFEKHWSPRAIAGHEVLLLGLGLGSVPILLEKLFSEELWYFTAIEIDEEIIDLAEQYTLPNLIAPIDVITADAAIFVQLTEQQFDLICVDIFLSDIIPDEFLQLEFLGHCKNLLTDNGQVIFNTLAVTKMDKQKAKDFFTNVYLKVFPDGRAIYCHRNLMLVSS